MGFDEDDHHRDKIGRFAAATSAIDAAMKNEKIALAKMQSTMGNDKGAWWTTPEFTQAAKEHKSAVRNRQKALREGKKLLASVKK